MAALGALGICVACAKPLTVQARATPAPAAAATRDTVQVATDVQWIDSLALSWSARAAGKSDSTAVASSATRVRPPATGADTIGAPIGAVSYADAAPAVAPGPARMDLAGAIPADHAPVLVLTGIGLLALAVLAVAVRSFGQ
jgi:hypothetical protein